MAGVEESVCFHLPFISLYRYETGVSKADATSRLATALVPSAAVPLIPVVIGKAGNAEEVLVATGEEVKPF